MVLLYSLIVTAACNLTEKLVVMFHILRGWFLLGFELLTEAFCSCWSFVFRHSQSDCRVPDCQWPEHLQPIRMSQQTFQQAKRPLKKHTIFCVQDRTQQQSQRLLDLNKILKISNEASWLMIRLRDTSSNQRRQIIIIWMLESGSKSWAFHWATREWSDCKLAGL